MKSLLEIFFSNSPIHYSPFESNLCPRPLIWIHANTSICTPNCPWWNIIPLENRNGECYKWLLNTNSYSVLECEVRWYLNRGFLHDLVFSFVLWFWLLIPHDHMLSERSKVGIPRYLVFSSSIWFLILSVSSLYCLISLSSSAIWSFSCWSLRMM